MTKRLHFCIAYPTSALFFFFVEKKQILIPNNAQDLIKYVTTEELFCEY